MTDSALCIERCGSSSESSEASDPLDLKDDEGWEDIEADHDQEKIVSLLDQEVFPDVASMLAHCKQHHGVDFLSIRQEFFLDIYGCIKLVNYIRSEVKEGRLVPACIAKSKFDKDDFLKPVLEDDAFLFNLDELPPIKLSDHENSNVASLISRVAELEEELHKTRSQFSDYRKTVQETLDKRWKEDSASRDSSGSHTHLTVQDDDTHYFNSYSYNDIHETMLKDTARTNAYRDFIYHYKHLFAGKTVLDVGCGTGILSLFCAKAGARRVIAVDNSAIIDKARENIYENGFSEKISCLRGKIEEVTLPVNKVDVIVSEWMGYGLLYEAMLDSIIWARDKYLDQGGLMVPSHMNMWIAPISDPDYVMEHIAFWRDVYGFDMKAMQAGIYDDSQILQMPTRNLCADAFPFLQLDLYSVKTTNLTFKRTWTCTLKKDIDELDGFTIWFDAFFMPSKGDEISEHGKAEEWTDKGGKGIAFTTGPFGRETHWRQCVFFVDNTLKGPSYREGDSLSGDVEYLIPKENTRALDITLSWSSSRQSSLKAQTWKMR